MLRRSERPTRVLPREENSDRARWSSDAQRRLSLHGKVKTEPAASGSWGGDNTGDQPQGFRLHDEPTSTATPAQETAAVKGDADDGDGVSCDPDLSAPATSQTALGSQSSFAAGRGARAEALARARSGERMSSGFDGGGIEAPKPALQTPQTIEVDARSISTSPGSSSPSSSASASVVAVSIAVVCATD